MNNPCSASTLETLLICIVVPIGNASSMGRESSEFLLFLSRLTICSFKLREYCAGLDPTTSYRILALIFCPAFKLEMSAFERWHRSIVPFSEPKTWTFRPVGRTVVIRQLTSEPGRSEETFVISLNYITHQ